jgi:hypothetical protein
MAYWNWKMKTLLALPLLFTALLTAQTSNQTLVVVVGTSLDYCDPNQPSSTCGWLGQDSWVSQLALSAPVVIHDLAIPGATYQYIELTALAPGGAMDAGLLGAFASKIVVYGAPTNDLCNSGSTVTPADVFTRVQRIFRYVAGRYGSATMPVKTVLLTMTDRAEPDGPVINCAQKKKDYNTLVAQASGSGEFTLADVAADSNIGADGARLNPMFFIPETVTVHLTSVGYASEARTVSAALNMLLTSSGTPPAPPPFRGACAAINAGTPSVLHVAGSNDSLAFCLSNAAGIYDWRVLPLVF